MKQLRISEAHFSSIFPETSLGLDANERQDLVEEYGKSLRDIFLTMYERFMKFWLYNDYIFYFSTVKQKQDAIIKGLHRLSTVVSRYF